MQFSEISYESDTEEYKFTPIGGYQLQGIKYKNVMYSKYIIIRYKLYYKNKISGKHVSSKINYFISDGHTNMFRANILFPTLCYSERDKENPVCPTFFDSSKGLGVLGGLLKIRFLKNIDESFIRNELIKNRTNPKYTRFYGDERCGCGSFSPVKMFYKDNGVTKSMISCKNCNKMLTNIEDYRATLPGVITARLENLLDLVIAVGSESVVNSDQYQKLVNDPTFLTPVYTEKQEYNLDRYDGPSELAKYIKGSNALYLSDESYEYRVSILKTLKTILNLLTSKTFSVELKTIKIDSISIDNFNKLDNVCKKINETNKNLQNYITISNHLHETCKILFKDEDFLLENNALTTFQRENIFNDPLKTIHLTWSSSCKLDTDDDQRWLPLNIQQKLKAEREQRLKSKSTKSTTKLMKSKKSKKKVKGSTKGSTKVSTKVSTKGSTKCLFKNQKRYLISPQKMPIFSFHHLRFLQIRKVTS